MENYPVTTPSEMPPPSQAVPRNALGVLAGGASAFAFYLVILGWNQTKEPQTCTGPYASGQVLWLALALVAVVIICALWRGEWGAAGVECVVLTALWVVDVLTVDDPCDIGADLWPIGAAFLLVGSALGLGLTAALTSLVRHRLRSRTW